ncbi:protein of unknown function (plasmid) [Caballeronia sp. S22]
MERPIQKHGGAKCYQGATVDDTTENPVNRGIKLNHHTRREITRRRVRCIERAAPGDAMSYRAHLCHDRYSRERISAADREGVRIVNMLAETALQKT